MAKALNNLFSVEAALREMNRLDRSIAAHKQGIKDDRADKARLNKVVALVQQMYPPTPDNVTNIGVKKTPCKTCGEPFTSRGMGVHIRMKHQGGAKAANKAATASRKRAAR